MAAFERILCGIPGLDQAFDNIRLGDNVVWQLDSLDDFRYFCGPFVEQALADGRTVHYMRFAKHDPLVQARPGVMEHRFSPHKGFEAFTIEIRSIITECGRGAFYVFDCLSDLQVAWSADMMMGNFFRLTCPYLFELDTVAYFPVLRGRHSFEAVAKIRDTTQLLIDVYRESDGSGQAPSFFVHPLKVWNRYSSTMFLPNRYTAGTREMAVCTDGVDAARFYALVSQTELSSEDCNVDSWDRFFANAQAQLRAGEVGEDVCSKMCNMMMTKDPLMRSLIGRYFAPQDYFAVRSRMVGTGHIGGKACGMLLARKIVETELPQYAPYMEPHDSFFLGTDVFYSYIVANGLWPLRIAQREESGFISEAPALQQGLLQGQFPEDIRARFRRILEYYGQSPIIVRSSSYLEDGFGNAFAGKYESVFCANAGPLEDRLAAFEDAVRTVYASTMDGSALEYRLRNGLHKREEQMALLIQRVSGSHYAAKDGRRLFAPTAAGVGYSCAAYRFMEGLDPEAGMLRLVAGLGTKAVDRTELDYPRMVSLDKPLATPAKDVAQKHRYSQHYADVLDLDAAGLAECDVQDLMEALPPHCRQAVFEHDHDAEARLREQGRPRSVVFASCEGLAANREFTDIMADVLRVLHRSYGSAVDIEYAVNIGEGQRFTINLLQCRPLRTLAEGKEVELPDVPDEDTYFAIHGEAMGASRAMPIDAVIVVDPLRYCRCPHAIKPSVAPLVGWASDWLTRQPRAERKQNVLLLAPGRLGTSSPELGVPVSFSQIAGLAGICEVACSEAGYSPELSYGSHMFQDLVEAEIYYGALHDSPRKAHYRPDFVERLADITEDVFKDKRDAFANESLAGVVKVYSAGDVALMLWHNHLENESLCGVCREGQSS